MVDAAAGDKDAEPLLPLKLQHGIGGRFRLLNRVTVSGSVDSAETAELHGAGFAVVSP